MSFSASFSQVENPAYALMLKGLLTRSVPAISCEQLSEKLERVVLLDAREQAEYDVSHIKNAKHVGYKTFAEGALAGISKDSTIVVYCSVGYRSEKIGERLKALGFANVYNLHGGIFEWVNQGNSVFNGIGETDSIHAYSKVWGIWLSRGKKVYD